MSYVHPQRVCFWLVALALSAQMLGLIFCGDADCLRGGSTENCAALTCNLLGKHSESAGTAASHQGSSCQCYCHGLIDFPEVRPEATPFAAVPFHASEVLQLVSSPVRNIDHPPLV